MIRAPLGSKKYWDKWVIFFIEWIKSDLKNLNESSKNPIYDPQYSFDLSIEYIRLAIICYSRGDAVSSLSVHFEGLLNAWELSNRLSDEICKEHDLSTCRDWDFSLSNLNHYNWCFWLVGLGLCLEIPDAQWARLLVLIGAEGEDILLDRVIASRQPARQIGAVLLHAKPYARLLKAIDAPAIKQAALLQAFVAHWYDELKRPPPKNRKAPTIEPFWYTYGDHNFEGGSYFGRWCIEAAAAVKVFNLDDSLCIKHEHYPHDLVKDTQENKVEELAKKPSFLARLFGKNSF
jgi:hypothetical protein